jgi:hypothetical protein
MKREISSDELLQMASSNDKGTAAHAYVGMDLMLKGNPDEARKHFEWVQQYGK